ncbi:MAG: hypothetical protein ACPGEG_02655 [Salibacteraceae bacterium]
MKKVLFISIYCILISCFGFAQSKVLLLGGQEFEGKLISEDTEKIFLEVTTKKGKVKEVGMWKDRVFSITTSGKEKFYYEVDTSDQEMYSVEEMRYYIFGQQDANLNHKTTFPIIMAAVVSGSLTFLMASDNNAFLLTAPVLGAILGSVVQDNRPKPKNARNPKVLSNPAYVEGYRKTARTKKILNSIKSAVIAGIVGTTAGLIVHSNKEE